jgi:hypothetical protein
MRYTKNKKISCKALNRGHIFLITFYRKICKKKEPITVAATTVFVVAAIFSVSYSSSKLANYLGRPEFIDRLSGRG